MPALFITCNKSKISKEKLITFPAEKINNKKISGDSITDAPKFFLYLTFDDGPTYGSRQVNELALSDSININVFVIGKFAFANENRSALFKSYQLNPFIEIGNHSFTHANSHHYHLYYSNPGSVKHDFLINNDTLHLNTLIARLPGRNCWRINGKSRNDLPDGSAAADSLVADGYEVFGWDVEWRYDSAGKIIQSADEMYNTITRIAEKGKSFTAKNIVILCHDPMLADSSNEAALKLFIQKVRADGKYRFNHLSSYPQ